MHLRVKRNALKEMRIIQVHGSVHFGALEMHCTSIWDVKVLAITISLILGPFQ